MCAKWREMTLTMTMRDDDDLETIDDDGRWMVDGGWTMDKAYSYAHYSTLPTADADNDDDVFSTSLGHNHFLQYKHTRLVRK